MDSPAKILGRSAPAATIETVLYTVPDSYNAHIQGFIVVNRDAAGASFRFSISPKGAATVTRDYLYYDLPIDGNDAFLATLDLELEPTDVVRIYASSALLSFALFGDKR